MRAKILFVIFFLISGFTSKPNKTKFRFDIPEYNRTEKGLSLRDSVKNYIKELNIKHPDIVFAQAILESGNFKSKIFKENHNLFGMRHPKTRATTSLGTNLGHAKYKDWKHSVLDYALWQSSYAWKKNEKEFYKYLKNVYAQDSLYIKKIKKIVNGIRK